MAAAARKLRLTHSTLSTQLRALENHFGVALFERRGKRLALTPFGTDAVSYASDIFRLGRELNDVARGHVGAGRNVLRVGLIAALPKTLAHYLLGPALDEESGSLLVRQDSPTALVEALVAGRLHVVLTNDVPQSHAGSKVHAHALGETNILLYARHALARKARRNFPKSLATLPFLLPPSGTPLRRRLDAWFVKHDIRPQIRAELDDAGLMRAFGASGRGVFPVRAAMKAEVEDVQGMELIADCEGLSESYYALSTERRIRHRGVVAIIEGARSSLNGTQRRG